MPISDSVVGILSFVFRCLVEVFFPYLVEILLKVPGCFLAKSIAKIITKEDGRKINPDGAFVIFLGLFFWAIIGVAAYIYFYNK